MNKASFAFFSGSLVPAIAIFALGGSVRSCLFAGVLLVLIPALLFPRKLAGWLYWYADAVDAVRGVSRGRRSNVGHLAPQGTDARTKSPTPINRKPPTTTPVEDASTPEANELESALINLQVPKAKAKLIAQKCQTGSFEERFRQAIKLVAA